MSAAALPSEARSNAAAAALESIRVQGGVRATFACVNQKTRVAHLAEHGGYRMLFPRTNAARAEAVVINTGGGVVGGDRIAFDIGVETGANVAATTQAAERIYRSTGLFSEIDVRLKVAAGAQLAWVPQETILFSGARLKRRIGVEVASDGVVLLAESTVFGRIASGETMLGGQLHDVWRIRREGRLIFSEATRLDDVCKSALERPAVLRGASAAALLLYVGPAAEARLPSIREAMHGFRGETGASAWKGMLAVRCVAAAPEDMRYDVMRAIAILSGAPLPRVWAT
jgi:urease accessory protein